MKVKDIKRGQLFSESEYGMTIIVEATEDARFIENREGSADGWEVDAVVVGGDGNVGSPVRFFAADCAPQYAPDLSPVYVKEVTP